MNIMGQIENGMQQLQIANAVKNAVIAALDPQRQISISSKIMGNVNLLPQMFITWVNTEEGKAAVREMADKFTGSKPESK
jgi:hypothetical protein